MPIWISSPAKVKRLGVVTNMINNVFDSNGNISPRNQAIYRHGGGVERCLVSAVIGFIDTGDAAHFQVRFAYQDRRIVEFIADLVAPLV